MRKSREDTAAEVMHVANIARRKLIKLADELEARTRRADALIADDLRDVATDIQSELSEAVGSKGGAA